MSRIECETAAQCHELAARMEALMEPLVPATLAIVVAFAVLFTIYQARRGDSSE